MKAKRKKEHLTVIMKQLVCLNFRSMLLILEKLNEKEEIVSVLMDEVYCQRSVQYVNGQFYGVENET